MAEKQTGDRGSREQTMARRSAGYVQRRAAGTWDRRGSSRPWRPVPGGADRHYGPTARTPGRGRSLRWLSSIRKIRTSNRGSVDRAQSRRQRSPGDWHQRPRSFSDLVSGEEPTDMLTQGVACVGSLVIRHVQIMPQRMHPFESGHSRRTHISHGFVPCSVMDRRAEDRDPW